MDFIFNLGWWFCYFAATIGLAFGNFRLASRELKGLKTFGEITMMFFAATFVFVFLKWGLLATSILLFYLFLTTVFKLKILYPYFKRHVPKDLIPLYDQFMIGKSTIDERSAKKSIEKNLKKKVSEYIDSL